MSAIPQVEEGLSLDVQPRACLPSTYTRGRLPFCIEVADSSLDGGEAVSLRYVEEAISLSLQKRERLPSRCRGGNFPLYAIENVYAFDVYTQEADSTVVYKRESLRVCISRGRLAP